MSSITILCPKINMLPLQDICTIPTALPPLVYPIVPHDALYYNRQLWTTQDGKCAVVHTHTYPYTLSPIPIPYPYHSHIHTHTISIPLSMPMHIVPYPYHSVVHVFSSEGWKILPFTAATCMYVLGKKN